MQALKSWPNSYQNYTDYFKCIAAKGDDFAPCKQFKRAYNSLCPSAYLTRSCDVAFTNKPFSSLPYQQTNGYV
jgi:hypothetical protein